MLLVLGDWIIGVFFIVEGGVLIEVFVKILCLLVLVLFEVVVIDGSEEFYSVELSLEVMLGFVCEEKVMFCLWWSFKLFFWWFIVFEMYVEEVSVVEFVFVIFVVYNFEV